VFLIFLFDYSFPVRIIQESPTGGWDTTWRIDESSPLKPLSIT
jgi:hypothetical protein